MSLTPEVINLRNQQPVLFLDDEPWYLQSIQAAARVKGVVVATAVSEEEGLAILKEQDTGAVVCDLRMSGKSGVAVLEGIRAQNPTMPLALHTGFRVSQAEQKRLDRIGARIYPKGVSADEIINSLLSEVTSSITSLKQLQQENSALRALNKQLLEDLKESLLQVPNPTTALIHDGFGSSYSVAELVLDIEKQNARGRDFIEWWLKARRRLRSMGKKV